MRSRLSSLFLAFVISAVPSLASRVMAITESSPGFQSGGVEVVGPEVMQPHPSNEVQASALSAAQQLMMDHPHDFGYPWLDVATGTLELSAATPDAAAIVANTLSLLLLDTPSTIRTVEHSYAELVGVADEIIELTMSTVVGADLIWAIEPDHARNRLIINISKVNDGLLMELATRFGSAVAVREAERQVVSLGDSRRNDPSPYNGGAQVTINGGACSDAFTWTNGSLWVGVLTAAHCIPNGGAVFCCNPQEHMGAVLNWSHENWEPGVGTVGYSGGGLMRGDVALVKALSNRSVAVRMWRGGADGNTSSIVRIVWLRWSQPGDGFCMGGRTSGEICGFIVEAAGIDVQTNDGWLRNAVRGKRQGTSPCMGIGDSGGSVFTLYQDGVAAKGVLSSFGTTFFDCFVWYTDIQHPVQALPGGVPHLP